MQILELGRRLLRLLALCLDLPSAWFLDRFLQPIAILRPLHYSPKLSRPDEVRGRQSSCGTCSPSSPHVLSCQTPDSCAGTQIVNLT